MRYSFTVGVNYDPNGARYEAGQSYDLSDWKAKDVRYALAAGLIMPESEDDHARTDSSEELLSDTERAGDLDGSEHGDG